MTAQQIITQHLDIWTTAHKTRSSAGRGSSNKLDLYGIKKLRELILGLGLRGLLTNDKGPLSTDFEQQILQARSNFYKKTKRKEKEIKYPEPLIHEFNLPSGWVWKRVGELCDLQTGATPSTSKPEYYNGDIKWLVSGDINKSIIFDCEGRITTEGLKNSNCKVLPVDTVMIALNGQGKTRATVALLKVEAACNQSLVGIIPFDNQILHPSFLFLALKYRYYEIREITGQNQRRGLNMGLVADLSVPLAPLEDQLKIINKVDELMDFCNQLEETQSDNIAAHAQLVEALLTTLTNSADHKELKNNWLRIAEHFDTLFTTEHSIDQLKQTILQLAVMGKLVPQDPNDEPASELLKKIAAEKEKLIKEGKIKKEKPLPEITDEEKPFELPRGWEWVRLANISDVGTGATPSRTNSSYYNPPEVNWVTSGETSEEYIQETKEKVSWKAVKETNVSIYPIGTLIIAMYGQGKTRGQITELLIEAGTNQACAAVHLIENSAHHRKYVKLFFIKAYDELREQSAGGAQPNLNVGKVSTTVIPLPPIDEQHRIVAKVDELMALCDTLKTNIQNAQATQLALADVLVERAVG